VQQYRVTVGADPEFFVTKTGSKKIEMACNKFGGTKGDAIMLTPDGGYLEDGTTVEFNIAPSQSLQECRDKISNLLLVFTNKHPEYAISSSSSARFVLDDLAKEPLAMRIGCAADLWAYGLRTAPQIDNFKSYRFAGGHIHVGIDPWPDGLPKSAFIKLVDAAWVSLYGKSGIVDKHRFPHYGLPGLYRETSYGIEYRTPDNYWCNPAMRDHLGPVYKENLDRRVKVFDEFIDNVRKMLNQDGHGAGLLGVADYLAGTGWDRNFLDNEKITLDTVRYVSGYEEIIRRRMTPQITKAA
jgi:hypothetical protein